MNSFKKICMATMLTSSLFVFTYDGNQKQDTRRKKRVQEAALQEQQAEKTSAIWAGVIGAVAGSALGYWIGSCETPQQATCCMPEKPEISYKKPVSPRYIQIQSQLDGLAKYGQNFNCHDDANTSEQNFLMNLHKLDIRLDQIDAHFYTKLAQDNKVLSDAGYSIWWYGFHNLENQKDLYLKNSSKLIAYFNRHQDFIRACQIINFYDALPADFWNMPTIMIYPARLPDWVKAQYKHSTKQYPLLSYVEKVEANKKELMHVQRNRSFSQGVLTAKLQKTQYVIDSLLTIIYGSFEYQQELEHKKQEELLAEYRRIEEEKLEIARKQNALLEQANKLAAEKNRIERERYQNRYNDRYR